MKLVCQIGENSKKLNLYLYVDNMLVTCNDPKMLQNFKVEIGKMFEMSNFIFTSFL